MFGKHLQSIVNDAAYFTTIVSYERKMFMKLTTGVNVITKRFFLCLRLFRTNEQHFQPEAVFLVVCDPSMNEL